MFLGVHCQHDLIALCFIACFSASEIARRGVVKATVSAPQELSCGLCKQVLREAVCTPCCGESFCDSCACPPLVMVIVIICVIAL